MAAEVKHALCTTLYWTANQAAMELLYGVSGYYTSIQSWITAVGRDLVADDELAVLECYTGTYGTNAVISGFTTDSTRHVIIRAAAGHEHEGVRSAGVVHEARLGAYENYSVISDIEIVAGSVASVLYTNNSVTYKNLIVEHTNATSGQYAFYSNGFFSTSVDSTQVLNCLAIGGYIGFVGSRGWSLINCTSVKAVSRGLAGGEQQKVINCIFQDGVGLSGFSSSNYGNNNNIVIAASIDADAGSDSFFVVDKDDIFADFSNDDFRPKTDSLAINHGLDTSYYTIDDITGYERS